MEALAVLFIIIYLLYEGRSQAMPARKAESDRLPDAILTLHHGRALCERPSRALRHESTCSGGHH
jgi:hypothetical protein